MFSRRRVITENDMRAAVQSAVQDATNSVTIASHMVECEKDKAEIKAELKQQTLDRENMHAENQAKFSALQQQVDKVMRFVWMAAGAGAVLSFMARFIVH